MKKYLVFIFLFCVITLRNGFVIAAPPTHTPNAALIELKLKKLTVLGNALYLAAHPDDENTAVLAYLSRGKLVRTGYLSLTRGDGGQNLIGKEKGEYLGILRTQELLAARRIDGASQFFTRAIDFGYSKTPEETLQKWDENRVLSDVVWVIRKFRPDVIITRFTPKLGGHGHHRASAILALKAFREAGDSTKFPEQLKFVRPWQPKRVVWNAWRWGGLLDSMDTSKLSKVDVGAYNPLLGESYTEVAARSRSMHKSQGFGSSARYGSYPEYFKFMEGDSNGTGLFAGVDLTWKRVPGSAAVQKLLETARRNYRPDDPAAVIPTLLHALAEMNKLPDSFWVNEKKVEVKNVIRDCAGLWMEAKATGYSVVPGGTTRVALTVLNRSGQPFILEKAAFPFAASDTLINTPLSDNMPASFSSTVAIPRDADYSQPYWLQKPASGDVYTIPDQQMAGLPENPPPLQVKVTLQSGEQSLSYTLPVVYDWTDPVRGERTREVEIVPPVTGQFTEAVYVFPDMQSKTVRLKIQSQAADQSGKIRLRLPAGWTAEPLEIPFDFHSRGEEKFFDIRVTPAIENSSGDLRAELVIDRPQPLRELVHIDYSHIPIQTVMPLTTSRLLQVVLKKKGSNIGYIMGPGDDIPQSIAQVGYHITMLDKSTVENSDLSGFDAIITGIRAYNTNPWLKNLNSKLLQYVHNGGTLLTQYNVTRGLVSDTIGPYPFEISHDRVTVEEAPVTFLQPDNSVLNTPNKISESDFNNWIQERGLYFADKWDPRYQTVIACHDPGEPPRRGGLLVASYGKGVYIYTGYAFFRQLPAGVPGAYRLFVNLISARQTDEK